MKICSGHPSRAPGADDVISLSSLLVPGRANFEPYGISPIGLSFKRPEQEAEYQAFIQEVTITYIRFPLVFGGVAKELAPSSGAFLPASSGVDRLLAQWPDLTIPSANQCKFAALWIRSRGLAQGNVGFGESKPTGVPHQPSAL